MTRLLVIALMAGPVLGYGATPRTDGSKGVAGDVIVLNDNAGWCWFQDPRVIVDGDTLIASTVADDSGPDGLVRQGNVEVTTLALTTKISQRVVLHQRLEDDDHDAAALLVRPDGRYVAVYGKHNRDRLMRWRISTLPGDATRWEPEQTVDVGGGYTYQNLFRLSREGDRIYNFHRGVGFNPNFMVSDDNGETFFYGGRLLRWNKQSSDRMSGGGRPYLRYASDEIDTIHFVTTEDHPRNFNNSIYHGWFRNGALYGSDGSQVATIAQGGASPADFTRVYAGGPDNVAWTVDLELERAGLPVALISVQHGDAGSVSDPSAGGNDLRYVYARFDGERWHTHPLAHGGTRLFAPEVDYSGLAAIDPDHTNVVYISTNADPLTGRPLISQADGQRHYEIFRGATPDGGATWQWDPITANSKSDNIRPTVPRWPHGTAILWLRGSYRSFRDYRTELVAIVLSDAER
jgi:hypothetical protein